MHGNHVEEDKKVEEAEKLVAAHLAHIPLHILLHLP